MPLPVKIDEVDTTQTFQDALANLVSNSMMDKNDEILDNLTDLKTSKPNKENLDISMEMQMAEIAPPL